MQGWIKLHRQIVNSSKFADPDILRLWIFCLVKASHKDTIIVVDRQEIKLKAGEFVTGRFSLHHDYNSLLSRKKKIKETTLWNWLKRLESWGDLDIKSTNKYSVVSIVKWDDYQDNLTTEQQQIDNRLTTDCYQIDTNKNVKNVKNIKKDIYRQFDHLSITQNEVDRLISEGYSKNQIDDILDRIENSTSNKKYKSLVLTARNWMKNDVSKVKQMPQSKTEEMTEEEREYFREMRRRQIERNARATGT